VTISVKLERDRVPPGQPVKLSWTVQGDCDSLSLEPATGVPAPLDVTHLAMPSGDLSLMLSESDAAAAPERKIAYTFTAVPKGGGAAVRAKATLEIAPPGPLVYKLASCALARGHLDDWMANEASEPFKTGSPHGPAIRCIRLGLFWNGNAAVSPLDVYNNPLAEYVKAFQNAQLADSGLDARLSALRKSSSDLVATGKFDRLTAALLDLSLLEQNDLPEPHRYKGVRVKEATFSDDPMSPKALAGRCIATLDYWAGQSVKYAPLGDRMTAPAKVFPVGIAFGDTWFVTTGNTANKTHWQTDCSSSTLAAFFWATRGQIGDLDFALDSYCEKHYLAWEIRTDRNEHPDGSTGVIVALGVGEKIELSPNEKQAAEDEIETERDAKKETITPAERQRRVKVRKLQKLVNKMREGDCVQGWIRENDTSLTSDERNEGHSFFVVHLHRNEAGNIDKYTILTANSGGVSRKEIAWNTYADPRIGRLYKIEGE
jgi:hypothetical protein